MPKYFKKWKILIFCLLLVSSSFIYTGNLIISNDIAKSDYLEDFILSDKEVPFRTPHASALIEIPFFSQRDPEWENDQIIDEYGVTQGTIGTIGCTMTSTAMALKCYGVDTDPKQLNNWLNENNGYASGGLMYWGKPEEYCNSEVTWIDNYGTDTWFFWDDQYQHWNKLKEELDNGYPVIIEVDRDLSTAELEPHWVLVTNFDGSDITNPSNYYINDPWDLTYDPDKRLSIYYDFNYDNTFFAMRFYHGQLEPKPIIIANLAIIQPPPYYIGDTITGQFTIQNQGPASIIFDVLTIGGRDPDDEVADFTFIYDITLDPGESYDYQGALTLNKVGNYHFFCAYKTPDGNWNTAIPTEPGITNVLDILVIGEPVITSSLIIVQSPPYIVGDTITGEFTITNEATTPFIFEILTIGGRDPEDEVSDFTFIYDITLDPGESYDYQGTLTLNKVGNYHFFCAYKTLDGNWNTAVPTESGITNVLDIFVNSECNPIHIDDDDPTKNWAITAATYDWCSGSGIRSDPYIIKDLVIDGGGSDSCIEIRNSNVYFRIEYCTVYNSKSYEAGISMFKVNNGVLFNNNCSNNKGCGIMIWMCSNNKILNNTINNNKNYGVWLYSSYNNTLSLITIVNNSQDGIRIEYYSDNNTIKHNNIFDNGWRGVYLHESSNNTLFNNIIENSSHSIELQVNSNNNKISGNILANNTESGISLSSSSYNIFSNNIIHNNAVAGIYLKYSDNNVIYLNNFKDNKFNGRSSNSINLWNSPEEINYTYKGTNFTSYLGNYWSDYAGFDSNNDGVGDTPYYIVYDNYDNYPLIMPFENYVEQPYADLPTLINGSPESLNISSYIYALDTVIYYFAYTDQYGVRLTDLSNQSYTWNRYNDEGIIIDSGAGTLIENFEHYYILDFDTETREVGKYVIIATLDKDGYDSKNATITLNIVKRVFDVILSGDFNNNVITIVKGTDIEIGVNISDLTRANIPLSGATVNLTIQEIWYLFTEKKPGIYNLTLNTDNYEFSGSSLTLSGEISIKKQDFETQTINITIIIESKEWTLNVSAFELSRKWVRNSTTSLPLCKSIINYTISNIGTENRINVQLTINVNGENFLNDIIPSLNIGENYTGQFSLYINYDNSKYVEIIASIPDIVNKFNFSIHANLSRAPRGSNERLFITPKDPIVESTLNDILNSYPSAYPDWMAIRDWVGIMINYAYDKNEYGVDEYYQLPRETILKRKGDCEDFALLLVSLLRANGWDSLEVYVVVGVNSTGDGYHAWVRLNLGFPLGWYNIEPQGAILCTLIGDHFILSDYEAIYMFNDLQHDKTVRLIKLKSPGELRVHDSQNRVTGVIDGEIINEIPSSLYDNDSKIVAIFSPSDSYYYQVKGTGIGTYGLEITNLEENGPLTFITAIIPTSANAIHQYTANWTVLSQGEEGVIVQVDSNGDGIFEYNFTSDSELTYDEFMDATGGSDGGGGGNGGGGGGGGGSKGDGGESAIPGYELCLILCLLGVISIILIKKRWKLIFSRKFR